jgi:hypothetical protein
LRCSSRMCAGFRVRTGFPRQRYEIQRETVSRVLEHAAIVRDHLGIDDFGAQRSQPPGAVPPVLQSKNAPKVENQPSSSKHGRLLSG